MLVALKFLHDRGLAHGSLSASNVLLSESGSAQLSDFENFFLGLPHGGSSRTDAVSRLRVPSSSLAAFDLYRDGHRQWLQLWLQQDIVHGSFIQGVPSARGLGLGLLTSRFGMFHLAQLLSHFY